MTTQPRPYATPFLERRAAALAYRGRHRSLSGSLTRSAAVRRVASMDAEYLAAEIRREARRRGMFLMASDRERLEQAARILDGLGQEVAAS